MFNIPYLTWIYIFVKKNTQPADTEWFFPDLILSKTALQDFFENNCVARFFQEELICKIFMSKTALQDFFEKNCVGRKKGKFWQLVQNAFKPKNVIEGSVLFWEQYIWSWVVAIRELFADLLNHHHHHHHHHDHHHDPSWPITRPRWIVGMIYFWRIDFSRLASPRVCSAKLWEKTSNLLTF